jgi:hypothetical protein
MKSLKALIVTTCALSWAADIHAQLLNGNFSAGNSNWTAGGFGTTASQAPPNGGIINDSFSLAGNYYLLNGPTGSVPGLSQSFTTFTNAPLRFSADYMSRFSGTGTNSIAVQILDSANTVLTQNTFNPTALGDWSILNITTPTFSAGTYRLLLIGQANGFDDDYAIDNVSMLVGDNFTNGDFELGDVFWAAGGFGTTPALSSAGRILNDAFSLSGNYYWLNGNSGSVPGLSQRLTTTGSGPLKISGNYASKLNASGTNSFVVQVLNSANTVLQQSTFNPTAIGVWSAFNLTTSSLPAGTYRILLIGQGNGFDDDYAVDNVRVSVGLFCDDFESPNGGCK